MKDRDPFGLLTTIRWLSLCAVSEEDANEQLREVVSRVSGVAWTSTYVFLVIEHGDVDPDEMHKRCVPILQNGKANRGLIQSATPYHKEQCENCGQSLERLVIRMGWTKAHPRFSSQTRHIEPIEQSESDAWVGEVRYLISNGKHIVVYPQALHGDKKQL